MYENSYLFVRIRAEVIVTTNGGQHSIWSAYINRKFDEFRQGKRGSAGTLQAFSNQFGATHSTVLGWMRPGAQPPRSYTQKIIDVYGLEAYEPLGIPVPESVSTGESDGSGRVLSRQEKRALDLIDQTPDEFKDEVLDLVEHYLLKHGFRRTG